MILITQCSHSYQEHSIHVAYKTVASNYPLFMGGGKSGAKCQFVTNYTTYVVIV